MDAIANFSYSTVATAPSPAASGTSLVLTAGQGTRFPATPFNAVVWPFGAIPTPANAEIVRVTTRATDTLTLTRTQESTSARTIVVGDQIAAAITAKTLTDLAVGWTSISNTDTGAQNNWAPSGLSWNTLIEWNGAADIALTGLAGGVAGQMVTIKNVTTTKIATFAHASGSSSAANRFTNYATVGLTPIAAGGTITYQHDGTNWQIVDHEQGAWITPAYAGGTYTAGGGTWTVDSGDVTSHKYRLNGRTLTFAVRIDTSSVASNAGGDLRVGLPAGFTSNESGQDAAVVFDNAVISDVGVASVTVGITYVAVFLKAFGNWANSTNNTYLRFTLAIEVQ